jgi:putative tryptophan/tyrosine transport system substrate-binding protein
MIGRREFITLLGGAAVAWPIVARAQQSERVRRIGVLMHTTSDEPDAQARYAGFLQGMQVAGWEVGRNLRIETRWSAGDVARLRQNAAELVGLNPDVILAGTGPTAATLLQSSRAVPIVFAQTVDPVGSGVVNSMSQPGGNITGFIQFDYDLSGKWLELLKEVAPQVKRVGVLRDFGTSAGAGQWAVIQAFSRAAGVELSPIDPRTPADIERGITAFARSPNGGLIVTASSVSLIHRELIVSLAERHRLPAVYAYRSFVTGGGLVSYGADLVGLYRLAAGYVDRILRGEKPADLPVQAPTKYEVTINLKTAKAIGLDIPPTLLARADEVIE